MKANGEIVIRQVFELGCSKNRQHRHAERQRGILSRRSLVSLGMTGLLPVTSFGTASHEEIPRYRSG